MKTLILFVASALVLLMSSCNQNSPSPAPAPAAPTPTPTPTPTNNFTSADSAISGNWILDLTELYSVPSNTLIYTQTHNDPINCHLNLKLIQVQPTNLNYKESIYGLNCTNVSNYWRLNSGYLEIANGMNEIISLSSTNLVLKLGSSSSGTSYWKFYLHK